MANSRHWKRSLTLLIAAVCVVVSPYTVHAEATQSGTWQTFPDSSTLIFKNTSGATREVMVTVCPTVGSGAELELEHNFVAFFPLALGRCFTGTILLANSDTLSVGHNNATPAVTKGTYAVSVSLP